jgi:5-methylcytosine-specific restriction endonuclease McrA
MWSASVHAARTALGVGSSDSPISSSDSVGSDHATRFGRARGPRGRAECDADPRRTRRDAPAAWRIQPGIWVDFFFGAERPMARRRKRTVADRTNELAKLVSEELQAKYPVDEPPDLATQLGIEACSCLYCGSRCKPHNIDELIPTTRCGTMRRSNCVPCCSSCNSSKAARTGVDLELWLVRRGSHADDAACYVTAERALAIAEYVERNEATLRWTGRALEEFTTELAYRKERYAEVDRHMADRRDTWHR